MEKEKKCGNVVVKRDPKLKALAKQFYLSGSFTTPEIVEKVGVPTSAIKAWMREGWTEERDNLNNKILSEIWQVVKNEYEDILLRGVRLVKGMIVDLENKGKPISIDEAVKLTGIVVDFDKIKRLDSNMPTEHVAVENISIDEIINEIKIDPFLTHILEKTKKEVIDVSNDCGTGKETETVRNRITASSE